MVLRAGFGGRLRPAHVRCGGPEPARAGFRADDARKRLPWGANYLARPVVALAAVERKLLRASGPHSGFPRRRSQSLAGAEATSKLGVGHRGAALSRLGEVLILMV